MSEGLMSVSGGNSDGIKSIFTYVGNIYADTETAMLIDNKNTHIMYSINAEVTNDYLQCNISASPYTANIYAKKAGKYVVKNVAIGTTDNTFGTQKNCVAGELITTFASKNYEGYVMAL